MKNYNTINGKDYRYISLIPEIIKNGLPKGILNKQFADVGGTYTALSSKDNYVVAVPTISLIDSIIKDKNITYKVFAVFGKVSEDDFQIYLGSNEIHKIVVTYDSFEKVYNWLLNSGEDISSYRFLIDEFHYLLEGYIFRNKAIESLIKTAQKLEYVTYLSATPIKQFIPDFLKNEPITKIKWGRKDKITVILVKKFNPIEQVISFISTFLSDRGVHIKPLNGELTRVEELYLFINSVNDIVTICKSLGIDDPSIVKVVCSDYLINEEKLAQVGLKVSKISTNNKKLNFMTSTCFAGTNIFTNNGLPIVISDVSKSHTLVDLDTTMYQIPGRFRKNENYNNVFGHLIVHFTTTGQEAFNYGLPQPNRNKEIESIQRNAKKSRSLISGYNKLNKREKEVFYESFKGNSLFVDYDDTVEEFKFSKNKLNFANYKFNLQHNIYHNGDSLSKGYSKEHFKVSYASVNEFNQTQIKLALPVNFKTLFQEYIGLREENCNVDKIQKYEKEYPIYKKAYDQIGTDLIVKNNYSEKILERYLEVYSKLNLGIFAQKVLKSQKSIFLTSKELKTEFIKHLNKSNIIHKSVGITAANVAKYSNAYKFEKKQKRVNKTRNWGYVITDNGFGFLESLGFL